MRVVYIYLKNMKILEFDSTKSLSKYQELSYEFTYQVKFRKIYKLFYKNVMLTCDLKVYVNHLYLKRINSRHKDTCYHFTL